MLVDDYKEMMTIGNHDKMCMLKSGKILVWMWERGHAIWPGAEKILTVCTFVIALLKVVVKLFF